MQRRSGFTLIEIIVVTGIISLAFMSVLYLVRRAIMIYYSNQNYLVASMVAQDGLELTRFVRDQNWLTNQPFYQNLAEANSDGFNTIMAIDYQATADDPATPLPVIEGRFKIKQLFNDQTGDKIAACNLDGSGNLSQYVKSDCAVIYTDADNHNFYTTQIIDNISDGARYHKTIFGRLIEVTYHTNGTGDPADDYLYVRSTVYWRDRGSERYLTLGSYLYDFNWKL